MRIKTIWDHREVISTLVVYDIKARYKQSVLGVGWAVLQPFMTMVVFTVIFSGFARVPTGNIPYPVFAFSALVFWTFFATALSKGTLSLVTNASLIRKIYLPREIFPIVFIFSACFDCAISFVILLGMMAWFHLIPTIHLLWTIPVFLLQLVLVFALSLFTGTLHARFRDVGTAIGLVTQMWMFLSPVAYPISLVPERYASLYRLNPMVGIIDAYRRSIVNGLPPDWTLLGISAAGTLVALVLCYRYFLRHEPVLADFI